MNDVTINVEMEMGTAARPGAAGAAKFRMAVGRARLELIAGGKVWMYVVGDEGVLLTPAQLEQRLVAMIDEEATRDE